jgi:hypothetical protein
MSSVKTQGLVFQQPNSPSGKYLSGKMANTLKVTNPFKKQYVGRLSMTKI